MMQYRASLKPPHEAPEPATVFVLQPGVLVKLPKFEVDLPTLPKQPKQPLMERDVTMGYMYAICLFHLIWLVDFKLCSILVRSNYGGQSNLCNFHVNYIQMVGVVSTLKFNNASKDCNISSHNESLQKRSMHVTRLVYVNVYQSPLIQ